MALALGVDTGGTFTDAVLIRDGETVVAKGKSLTTRQDLAIGVGGAVRRVLEDAGAEPSEISFAALSTTLATNALVEGQGGSVGLIYIGFRDGDLDKHGLTTALRGDPAVELSGGHGYSGTEKAALDLDTLQSWLLGPGAGASGYAVASQFATRNPAHELAAAQMVAELTGAPATCSHMLSAKLNGPKRALTALLNARLIGLIDRLIDRAAWELTRIGVTAPLMVVRGDGALMSADQARERPIETILSGPAASLIGAKWLTGCDTALVSDIGGTTTDVALLDGGRPAIDPLGAQVGGDRTMVEAVAMRTTGLGGDSAVHVNTSGLSGGVRLGPRRLVPVSLIATEARQVVHAALDAQLAAPVPGEHDARFLRALPDMPRARLTAKELDLLERIGTAVHPLADVLRNRRDAGTLTKLVDRGLVQICGITPSDACHMLGLQTAWDQGAADKALTLLARKRAGHGNALARNPAEMAQMILDQLTRQTMQALLETALAEEADPLDPDNPASLADHPMLLAALQGRKGLVSLDARLDVDVVGLGASAATHYPAVGRALRCRMHIPADADVANAIGAVVGQIEHRQRGTVTSPSEGRFRAHLPEGPEDFSTSEDALIAMENALEALARQAVLEAGAADITVLKTRDIRKADVESREVFVEAELVVTASGRPRIAAG